MQIVPVVWLHLVQIVPVVQLPFVLKEDYNLQVVCHIPNITEDLCGVVTIRQEEVR